MEWNESEGSIKRIYSGLRKNPSEIVQFDTTKNHFLVAGDDFAIKFWDMDNPNILHSIVADGGLPVSCFYHLDHLWIRYSCGCICLPYIQLQASPKVKFNREGTLLAVTTSNCRIKILANTDGQRIVMMHEGSQGPSQHISTIVKVESKPPNFWYSSKSLKLQFLKEVHLAVKVACITFGWVELLDLQKNST